MKTRKINITVGLLFFAVFAEIAAGVDSYTNSATVPPSLRRQGLVRSPAQVDGSGNLLITGNTRGGNYFRGVVPYRAPTDFGTTLPSSSLDSFLRDSTGSEDLGRRNQRYDLGVRPYYSPTQTVPSIYGAVRASTTNISASSLQSYINGTLPMRRDEMLDPASALSLARLRPMSMTPAEMQRLISSEIANSSPARLIDRRYLIQPEQPQSDVNQESYKTAEIRKFPMAPENILLLPDQEKPDSNLPGEPNANIPIDIYDSMKWQLDNLQKKLAAAMNEPRTVTTAGSAEDKGAEKPAEQQLSQTDKLAEVDLTAARTENTLSPYQTFASFSEDKFNQNMRAAELYLKQGRYYRAADAYTLASLYKPDDPLAYAGKSHALFASGEYMSSALFLSRSLQLFPEYARFKVDIVAMVGSRDTLESRIADIKEWLTKRNAPELQFLLAYVYYQMDRPEPAKEAIEQALQLMPDVPAVLTLKKAIEDSPAVNNNEGLQRITDGAEPKLSL